MYVCASTCIYYAEQTKINRGHENIIRTIIAP